jgi:hypothetical protein
VVCFRQIAVYTAIWQHCRGYEMSPGRALSRDSYPFRGSCSPGRSLCKATKISKWAPVVPCQSYICYYAEVQFSPNPLSYPVRGYEWAPDVPWAEIRALRKLLAPRPEKSKFRHEIDFKKTNPFRQRSNVWAIQRYQKTYLEISWDYPFKITFHLTTNTKLAGAGFSFGTGTQ